MECATCEKEFDNKDFDFRYCSDGNEATCRHCNCEDCADKARSLEV